MIDIGTIMNWILTLAAALVLVVAGGVDPVARALVVVETLELDVPDATGVGAVLDAVAGGVSVSVVS